MALVKICMPISAEKYAGIAEELYYINSKACDIVEWRYDYLKDDENKPLADLISEVKSKLNNKPLLFTYRTLAEGGFAADDVDNYYGINMSAIRSGRLDIVDIECGKEQKLPEDILAIAHEKDVKVMISKHLFDVALKKDEIIEMLCRMQETGGDIVKLAVSVSDAQGAQDVMGAAKEMFEKYAKVPIVTIGMGEAGKITRYPEPFYGSSITYVRGFRETAPSQLSIEEAVNK